MHFDDATRKFAANGKVKSGNFRGASARRQAKVVVAW